MEKQIKKSRKTSMADKLLPAAKSDRLHVASREYYST